MDDLLGHTIGSYQLDSTIGHGPTGNVYHGLHVRTAQPAAVKILDPSIAVGVEFPDRFLAEMRTVSALRHRNIVTVCECGVSPDGHCFIAMELLRAGSLGALLRRRPPAEPLPVTLTVNLMCQAAEGLAHAHQQGVVHKDIRPSNLLLDHSADAPAVLDGESALKITDFGLAQLVAGGSALTSVGMVVGTGVLLGNPAYMSPEQCRGHALDSRSDLYSLGIVLYEMTTGILPFAVRHLEDAARAHLFTPPPLPRLLNSELPVSLEQVVLRCLAKHPDDRYDTGIDLVRAMRAAVPSA